MKVYLRAELDHDIISVVFGSPPVGPKEFKKNFKKLISGKSFNFINPDGDFVSGKSNFLVRDFTILY